MKNKDLHYNIIHNSVLIEELHLLIQSFPDNYLDLSYYAINAKNDLIKLDVLMNKMDMLKEEKE